MGKCIKSIHFSDQSIYNAKSGSHRVDLTKKPTIDLCNPSVSYRYGTTSHFPFHKPLFRPAPRKPPHESPNNAPGTSTSPKTSTSQHPPPHPHHFPTNAPGTSVSPSTNTPPLGLHIKYSGIGVRNLFSNANHSPLAPFFVGSQRKVLM